MKHKNILKGGLLAFLIMANTAMAFTDPVTGDVLFIDNQGKYHYFWMDTTQNGIADTAIGIPLGSFIDSLLSRYIKEGGKVFFEKVPNGEYQGYNHEVIIDIIMPNTPETPENLRGKRINVLDLFPAYSDSFPYAQRDGQR
jgi:hypothetical protein